MCNILFFSRIRNARRGLASGAERHWRRRASIGEGQFVLPVFLQFRGVVVAGVEARPVVVQVGQQQAGEEALAQAEQGAQAMLPGAPVEQLAVLASGWSGLRA